MSAMAEPPPAAPVEAATAVAAVAEGARPVPDPTPPSAGGDVWTAWQVSGSFEVKGETGLVDLVQVDEKNFLVTNAFRFRDQAVLDRIKAKIDPKLGDPAVVMDDARTYADPTLKTDLASIPSFMRWFVNNYGKHTLAAIIHDRLITDGEPNTGALGSDTLSDRFFREMMGASGIGWLQRWIMWAAVAMRSRWAAGGVRRASLVVWGVLAACGISLFVVGAVAALGWGHLLGIDANVALTIAVVMPFVGCLLWGKQRGASLVAALAALWIFPPAILALVGYAVYWLLSKLTSHYD